MPRLSSLALIVIFTFGALLLPAAPVAAAEENVTPKVAVIVGPVGPSLTPHYLQWAEWTATAAEKAGAVVERAYSPHANAEKVLSAVADANIVVYYGHGWGSPSPYAANAAKQNGWALNGPNSVDHSDSTGNGTMVYYGAPWLVANAKPAPGFVMVYANTCYAPGAPDGPGGQSTPAQAFERASNYSAPIWELGASGYYANDFYRGAEGVVERLLTNREGTYHEAFAADERYFGASIMTNPHPTRPDAQFFQQRSTMLISKAYGGNGLPRTDYFMAFAGNPKATPASDWNVVYDSAPPVVVKVTPAAGSRQASPSGDLIVTFDESVTGASPGGLILNDVSNLPASFTNVPAKLTYNDKTFTATVDPTADLIDGHTYELYVHTSVADASGHLLERPFMARFVVDGTAPKLTASYPEHNQLFPPNHELRLFADEQLKVDDTEAITLTNAAGEPAEFVASVGQGGEIVIDPIGDLAFDANYTLTVAAGAITDAADNDLPAVRRSFKTDRAAAEEAFMPRALADGEISGDLANTTGDDAAVINADGEAVLVTSRGPLADRAGYWFVSGNRYIAEGATAHLPGMIGAGPVWQSPLGGDEVGVTIPVGDHAGVTVGADGRVAASEPVSIDEPIKTVATSRAIINGVSHLLISEGVFAEQWLPEVGLMFELPTLPDRTRNQRDPAQ